MVLTEMAVVSAFFDGFIYVAIEDLVALMQSFFSIKEWPCNLNVEELNQWSHEEGRDNGSYAYNCRHLGEWSPGHQKEHYSQDDADKVSDYPDILELALFPRINNYQCHGIISGNTQIRRHIEG